MKTTLLLLFLFCAAAAFGQVGGAVLPNQPQILELPDHPQHAEPHPMGREQFIVGGASDTYHIEHGERPLSDFGLMSVEPEPLGDVARAYRKQKLMSKKAEIVFEKQGS
jgi:hypothetical protein